MDQENSPPQTLREQAIELVRRERKEEADALAAYEAAPKPLRDRLDAEIAKRMAKRHARWLDRVTRDVLVEWQRYAQKRLNVTSFFVMSEPRDDDAWPHGRE